MQYRRHSGMQYVLHAVATKGRAPAAPGSPDRARMAPAPLYGFLGPLETRGQGRLPTGPISRQASREGCSPVADRYTRCVTVRHFMPRHVAYVSCPATS